jgi:hypothetical protein
MEREGSLPHSQVPATCLYRNPDLSSQCPIPLSLNIILPSMSGYFKSSLFLRFPNQTPVCTSSLPHTGYILCQSHSSRFYPLHNSRLVQIIKFLIRKLSPLSCYLVPLRPKYSPQVQCANTYDKCVHLMNRRLVDEAVWALADTLVGMMQYVGSFL